MKTALRLSIVFLGFLACNVQANAQAIQQRNLPLQLVDDVQVAALEAGVIAELKVVPGDVVQAGQVLVELDRDLHEGDAAVKKMAWQVSQAEAGNDVNLRFAQKSLMVNEKVLEKSLGAVQAYAKSISETEIDKLRLERDQAELSIEQAHVEQEVAVLTADLRSVEKDLAEIELNRRSIRAPLNGMVVELPVQKGEAIGAGDPAVRIISLEKLKVIANVDLRFAFKVKSGDVAEFVGQVDGQAVSFPAKVVFVSPEIRYTEQSFDVWVEVENVDGKLLPGMKGNLQITPGN